jgi:Ni,Fe-hydrogenase III small subunit
MGRFGIEFVASSRHADGIMLSGTTTRNMEQALAATYEAEPAPKLVVLFGACAISGGIFQGSDQLARKYLERLKIDLYIPGCPPHPLTSIYGLLIGQALTYDRHQKKQGCCLHRGLGLEGQSLRTADFRSAATADSLQAFLHDKVASRPLSESTAA